MQSSLLVFTGSPAPCSHGLSQQWASVYCLAQFRSYLSYLGFSGATMSFFCGKGQGRAPWEMSGEWEMRGAFFPFPCFLFWAEVSEGCKRKSRAFISWKIDACRSGSLLGNHRTRERPPPRRRKTERRGGGGEGPEKQGQGAGPVKKPNTGLTLGKGSGCIIPWYLRNMGQKMTELSGKWSDPASVSQIPPFSLEGRNGEIRNIDQQR